LVAEATASMMVLVKKLTAKKTKISPATTSRMTLFNMTVSPHGWW
jgi:hypothetical protein